MVRPIDGQASMLQQPNLLELIQTAQREAAIARLKHEAATEKAKDLEQTSVVRYEETQHKAIRDDDPRRSRQRRRSLDDELGHAEQEPAPEGIDIII